MGSYTRRLQAPTKERTAEWIPEDGELFRDSAGNFYMGDNVTASNALTAIGGGGGGETPVGIPYTFEATYNASGIAQGEVRVNNATAGSITAMYVHENDVNAVPFGNTLATLSAGGLVYLNTTADDTVVAVFKITAAVDSGTYYTLTGTFLSGSMPGDGSAIRVTIAPAEVTGVKRWRGFVEWNSGSPPSVVVNENSMGGTLVFSDATTNCLITLAGVFGASAGKVDARANVMAQVADEVSARVSYVNSSNLTLVSIKSDGTDELYFAGLVIIEVFP